MNVVVPPLCAGLLSAFEVFAYILTIIYKDHTKYNVIKVNKSTNNNNGKNRINTSRKRDNRRIDPVCQPRASTKYLT